MRNGSWSDVKRKTRILLHLVHNMSPQNIAILERHSKGMFNDPLGLWDAPSELVLDRLIQDADIEVPKSADIFKDWSKWRNNYHARYAVRLGIKAEETRDYLPNERREFFQQPLLFVIGLDYLSQLFEGAEEYDD
jgi:hypothetical protein